MFDDAVRDGSMPRRRFLGGYGPLAGLVVALVATALLLPTQPPIVDAGSAGTSTPVVAVDKAVTGDVGACPDRPKQVVDDPYSPPCFTFAGDNGGTTAKGVTPTDVVVSYRRTTVADYQALIGQMAGVTGLPPSTPEDIERTFLTLVEWFNRNFQFYGRKLEVVPFDGRGAVLSELFGGGQDAAAADAATAANDLGAFADSSALTIPYNDALTRKKVIALGAPYVSDQYFTERHPYAWSLTPSCTLVSRAANQFGIKQLLGKPAAYAGGDLKDKPRKVAIVSPDNPEYQRCLESGLQVAKDAGYDILALPYQLDLASESNQAASLISKLKAEGVTSVGCACDPLLPVYLTGKAEEQGYQPEWLVMGTALTDTDMGGQLYSQNQWKRAFGATALGQQPAFIAQAGYKAYKAIRPQDEPAFTVDVIFFQLYMLALGVQMAGPDLTPDTFAQGLQAYGGGTGEAGTWSFPAGKHTPSSTVRVIWWDPDAVSPLDGKKGSYQTDGKEYSEQDLPSGELKVFTK